MAHSANLTNTVYEFGVGVINAAEVDNALYQADIKESDADQLPKDKRKFVRIGSYDADVKPTGGDLMKEFNGNIPVEFMVRPNSQSLADRITAREEAHQMAMEFADGISQAPDLNGRSCHCEVTGKSNGFRVIQTARYQISILSLAINRKDFQR